MNSSVFLKAGMLTALTVVVGLAVAFATGALGPVKADASQSGTDLSTGPAVLSQGQEQAGSQTGQTAAALESSSNNSSERDEFTPRGTFFLFDSDDDHSERAERDSRSFRRFSRDFRDD